jgi:two-component system sensor histidine kinase HydH
MARRQLSQKGVEVILSAPQTLPPIRLDTKRIKQALLNLLLNAMEAMPSGGTIRLSVTSDKKWVHLSVGDTGHGIPKGQLKTIFEPFFTTKEKGSGLGLAMVAKVVEDHRGRIEVRSEPEKGTTFILSLPIG